jgi:hypothetical protein
MVSLIINAIDFYEKTLTDLAPVSHQQGRIARAVSK